jgi:hypothetical protein
MTFFAPSSPVPDSDNVLLNLRKMDMVSEFKNPRHPPDDEYHF